ncbi:MAG TPA: TonB-dependent receptor [Flavobacteriaceae bacterium]|nr:TonB-dependent receptor [Flavobacteriaceae bacterium]
MKIAAFLFLCFGFSSAMLAQNDSVQVLDPVILHASKLNEFSNTQHVRVFNDSLLKNAKPLLTDILNHQTSIYFKENGAGMVSSASFRGTTASQTAVVWNGININSKFNGQTDFNTISIVGFDEISVRSGGGSVLFGTGAIGGSVHLNNNLQFNKGFENEVHFGYGSFDTQDIHYKMSASDEKTSVEISIARTKSNNDFPYPGTDRKNLNGQYENTSIKTGLAYRINENNLLKIHTSIFDGERHFSLIRPSETPTKYQDFHTWNLIAWERNFKPFSSELKVAYLNEQFNFFPNVSTENHTGGKAETFIGNYNLGVNLKNGMEFHALLDYSYTTGSGSNMDDNSQKIASAALLLKQRLSNRFLYEIGAKKEFTKNYKSPFLFSAGATFKTTEFYSLKINISKNYRIPTFNDLYWEKSGNINLKPETSHQAEIGNYFRYKNAKFSATAFFISVHDMIQWTPSTTIWEPINVDKVQSYGLESNFDYKKHFGKHQFLFHANYEYTISEDENTHKQLRYVPVHKVTASLGYSFKEWDFFYDFLYVGEVFTTSDNDPKEKIPGYSISNIGASYSFLMKKKKEIEIGSHIRNLFNEAYQNVENRFMPGINFNLYLNFKF